MRGKKLGLILGVLLLTAFSLVFISAANECVIKSRQECNGAIPSIPAGKIIIGLSGTSNAHGELYNQSNYQNVLCCNFGDGIQANECSQPGYAKIIRLSSETNAHAEVSSDTVYPTSYPNNVCYQASGLSCQTITSGSCPTGYSSILSLSATNNAHIGGPNDYPVKICCAVGLVIPPRAYWSSTSMGTQQLNSSTIQINGNVYAVGKNLDAYIGQSLTLNIYEWDPVFNDDVKSVPISTDSNGDISYTWQVTQTDWNIGIDGTELDDGHQEFEFEILDANDQRIFLSNRLELSLDVPTAYWSRGSNDPQINDPIDIALGNEDLYMILNSSGLPNGPILFEVYEDDDTLGREEIRTISNGNAITGTVLNGRATALITLNQTDWDIGDGLNDGSTQEYLFVVNGIESYELSVTSGGSPPPPPCDFIDLCGDYTDSGSCNADNEQTCGAGANNFANDPDVDCTDADTYCGCWWDEEATAGNECGPNVNYTINPTYCGDSGVQRPNDANLDEQCDPDNQILSDGTLNPDGGPVFLTGEASCTDHDSYTEGTLGCYGGGDLACQFDATGCTGGTPTCGDNLINQPEEECDGTALRGWDCTSFGLIDGTLKCKAPGTLNECTFDKTSCIPPKTYCGDDIQQVPNGNGEDEECDDGNLINNDGCSATCTDEGTTYCGDGTIQKPNDNGETEQCEDGNTAGGDGCSLMCQIEPRTYCGDNAIQNPNSADMFEQCDGTNLGSTSTSSLASDNFYTGGALTCTSYCAYSYSACTGNTPECSNGIIDDPLKEECDSPDFGIRGNSCEFLGFESGTVGCTINCKVDTSQCNEPVPKSGSCQVTQDTADDCSDGFLSFRWFGQWIGDIIEPKTSQCVAGGSDTIPCPAQIQLPFFSAYNVIAIIIVAGLIYLIISKRKKRPGVAASGRKR